MGNPRVLIVEDEPDGGVVVSDLLAAFEIDSDVAQSAEDALEFLQVNHYDAAVIDLALPGMNGFELLQHIRNDEKIAKLPCIAYTAYHSSQVRHDAMKLGFDAYLEKPLSETLFMRTLERLLPAV